jgi:hypothetical protein
MPKIQYKNIPDETHSSHSRISQTGTANALVLLLESLMLHELLPSQLTNKQWQFLSSNAAAVLYQLPSYVSGKEVARQGNLPMVKEYVSIWNHARQS